MYQINTYQNSALYNEYVLVMQFNLQDLPPLPLHNYCGKQEKKYVYN